MPKCPKCREEITKLTFSAMVVHYGVLSADEEFYTKEYGDWADEEYCCPECEQVLFTQAGSAIEFLKG